MDQAASCMNPTPAPGPTGRSFCRDFGLFGMCIWVCCAICVAHVVIHSEREKRLLSVEYSYLSATCQLPLLISLSVTGKSRGLLCSQGWGRPLTQDETAHLPEHDHIFKDALCQHAIPAQSAPLSFPVCCARTSFNSAKKQNSEDVCQSCQSCQSPPCRVFPCQPETRRAAFRDQRGLFLRHDFVALCDNFVYLDFTLVCIRFGTGKEGRKNDGACDMVSGREVKTGLAGRRSGKIYMVTRRVETSRYQAV